MKLTIASLVFVVLASGGAVPLRAERLAPILVALEDGRQLRYWPLPGERDPAADRALALAAEHAFCSGNPHLACVADGSINLTLFSDSGHCGVVASGDKYRLEAPGGAVPARAVFDCPPDVGPLGYREWVIIDSPMNPTERTRAPNFVTIPAVPTRRSDH